MGISTVKSPWCSEGNTARSADNPPGRSPLSTRADRAGGHLSTLLGKGAISSKLLRRGDDGDHVFQHAGGFENFPGEGNNRFKG
jgi:hypothetical protein